MISTKAKIMSKKRQKIRKKSKRIMSQPTSNSTKWNEKKKQTKTMQCRRT